jgi:valyl-tRNA synthetase
MGELARAIQEVTQAIEAYRFNDAANAAYRFVWNIVCDWYLELSKPVFSGADTAAKAETQASIAYVIDETCRLLHPFMPFITEEIWGLTGQEGPKRDSVLALAAWPDGKGLGDQEAEQEIGWLVDLVTDIRSARAETNVPGGAQVPLVLVNPSAQTQARVARWSDMIKRLARISDFSTAPQAPKQAIGLIVRGEVVALPLEGIIDLEAERARLGKEIDKISSEAEKIKAKLANADFVARAPEEVVEEQRERLEDGAERLVKLREALARLA